jgi:ribonuclease HII
MKKTKVCENTYEHECWSNGQYVLGIDEAGRGPLAGPLVTAGVVFEIGYENPLIYDSKAISEKKREELFEVIKEDALYYEIRIVSEEDIDRYNIYRADQMAMQEIAETIPCDFVITDAMPLALNKEMVSLVKGDQKSISVAAGSILAKVTRDRIMKYFDEIYPVYGFAQNKGYPTKAHMQAIEEYGITPIHRKSFGPVAFHQEKLF